MDEPIDTATFNVNKDGVALENAQILRGKHRLTLQVLDKKEAYMRCVNDVFSSLTVDSVARAGATLRVQLLGLLLTLSACEAIATLGQAPSILPASSAAVASSEKKLAVTPGSSSVPSSLYTLHEAQLENGTRVQEFASPAGIVFAVTWHGPVLPDLSALLGHYFMTFKGKTDQARLDGKRGSPVNIERDDLVVRSNGRMRNFFGYAYAPDLIPAGVRMTDVLQ